LRIFVLNMAKIITISALKGGVGKSTLAYNLAYYFESIGKQVVVIDCDVGQFSVLQNLKGIQVISREQIQTWQSFAEGAQSSQRDFVLIDTGPYRAKAELEDIHAISDYILIPTRASKFDKDSLKDTLEIYAGALRRVSSAEEAPQAGIILTMGRKNAKLYKQIRKQMEAKNYPVLQSEMEYRSSWEGSVGVKGGVLKYRPKDSKAIEELTRIGQEILMQMNHGKR